MDPARPACCQTSFPFDPVGFEAVNDLGRINVETTDELPDTRGTPEAIPQLFITRALKTPEDDRALGMIKTEVEALCQTFPLYPA